MKKLGIVIACVFFLLLSSCIRKQGKIIGITPFKELTFSEQEYYRRLFDGDYFVTVVLVANDTVHAINVRGEYSVGESVAVSNSFNNGTYVVM